MNSEIECIKFGREGDKIIEEISDDKFNPVDFCKLFEKSGVKRIEYISKGRYFELSMGNIPVLDPNSGFIENMRFNEKLDSQEGKNFGWKVTLTNPNVRLNAQSIVSCSTKKCIENKRYPIKFIKNSNIIGVDAIHRGHLLAYAFFDCIPYVSVQFTKEKKGTRNKYNIYAQFKSQVHNPV